LGNFKAQGKRDKLQKKIANHEYVRNCNAIFNDQLPNGDLFSGESCQIGILVRQGR
jgi:hypothetical protein